MTIIEILSLIIGLAYLLTAFVLFQKVMPCWREINRAAALCAWALGLATGWFGTVLLAESLHFGPQIQARLAGHLLMLLGLWCGIAAQLHFGHRTQKRKAEL
jgi:apolipoprotein N-acyltransferase